MKTTAQGKMLIDLAMDERSQILGQIKDADTALEQMKTAELSPDGLKAMENFSWNMHGRFVLGLALLS